MSKGKKTPKPSSTADLSNWDDALIKDQLGNSEYKPCVVIVSPENCAAESQLQLLQQSVSSGLRKRFTVIAKEPLLASARDDLKESAAASGGKKSKQAKNAPAAAEKPAHLVVCEHTVQAMDTGEVPASLVARMVKYKLLRMEKKELQLRAEAKAAEEAAKNPSAKGKGAASKGGKNTSASGKKGGKGGGKETPSTKESTEQMIPVPQKEPTKLRKRGEEDTALQTIDDEPTDGPDAYFILTGIDEAAVLEQLDVVNVSVMIMVRLSAEDNGPPSTASEEEIEAYNNKNNKLSTFWKQLGRVTSTNNEGSMLLNMSCNELTLPAAIPNGDEEKVQYGSEAFDKLADMIYTTLDQYGIYQSYLHYTDYNKLMLYSTGAASTTEAASSEPPSRVVTPLQSITAAGAAQNVDMSYYNKLLSHVPEDHTTVELMLHCMVEQVSVKCSGDDVMGHFTKPVNGVEVGLSDHMSSLINGLALSDTHTTSLNGTSPGATAHMTQSKKNKAAAPTILFNRDYISMNCYGLKDVSYFNVNESASAISQLSIFQNLLKQQQSCTQDPENSNQFAAERQAIQHHCITGDLTQQSFYHYLFCLCFEQLPLHCDCNVTGNKDPVLFQFDTPLLLAARLKDKGTLVAVDTDATPPPATAPATGTSTLDVSPPLWDMSQYEVQAIYDLPVLLQIVQHLYHQYPFTVMGKHQLTNCLLLAMHNGHDGKLLQQHTDSNQLHCKVGFSKFLGYVWDKFGEDITKAAEEDKERKKQFELQKQEEIAAVMKIIEEELKSKEEEQQPKSAVKGKANSGKKTSVAQKPAAVKQDSAEAKEEDERVIEICSRQFPERKLYVGYEVGNRVLLVDNLTTVMYPLDGSQVIVRQREIAERDTALDVCLLSHQSLLTCNLTLCNSSNQPGQPSAIPNGIGVLIGPKFPVKKGSFFASLDNGCLTVSTSCYGPFANGQVAATVDATAAPTTTESAQFDSTGGVGAQPSPRPGSRGQSPGRKISRKDLEIHEKQLQEQQRLAEEKRERERQERERQQQERLLAERRQNKYLPLFVSLSNGLHVQCKVTIDLECDQSITDGSDGQFVIRQDYPTSSASPDGLVKLRSIMSTGEVIKCFGDEKVEILTADGRIMKTASPSETNLMASASEQFDQVGEIESATKVTFKDTDLLPPVADLPSLNDTVWMITLPTGERYLWKKVKVVKEEPPADREPEDGQRTSVSAQGSSENDRPEEPSVTEQQQPPTEEYKPVVLQLDQLDSYTATDPVTKEVLVTRIDNTLLLTRPDGTLIVEYSDGTRFTSHYDDQHQLTQWTVEYKGYARTSWNVQSRVVSLEFDNGSNITCYTDGHYDISTSNGINLHLASDGSATYHCADGVAYNMDHSGNNDILSATDKFGNKFNVNSSGVASVESSMDEEILKAELHKAHPPRYFVIQPDNTAYQLLRNDDISVAVETAQSHPQGAVVAKGNRTTVMMPFEQDSVKRSPYKEGSFIPPNLQPFTNITPTTKQSSNTNNKFGTTVGKGLMIGAYQPPPKPKQVSVPSAIIVDQYLSYPPMNESVRNEVYRGLAQYIEWRDKQASELQALQPTDDRSREECDKADKLISLYADQVNDSSVATTDDYLTAINPPAEAQEQPPVSRGTPQKLVNLQKELASSAEAKQALRDQVIPPYFKSTQGKKFLMSNPPDVTALSSKVPRGTTTKGHVSFEQDSRTRSPSEMELAVLKEDSRLSTPAANGVGMAASGMESPTQSEIDKQVTSTSRPMNPTPSHASGQGTPTAIRPLNPTPLQATATPLGANNDSASMLSIPMGANRPHNPTPARARQVDSRESSYVGMLPNSAPKMETMSFHMQESSEGQEVGLPMQKRTVNRSTYFNVTGEMRNQPVQLPSFIKGARPGEIPNEKFITIEEPVRRKVMTSSLARKQERRGFVLIPDEVVFGVLKEGCSYSCTVTLRNTGVDSCRYKIKQPPPSTGLRVHYTPGPVAAGMKAEIKVEIFAMAIGSSSCNGVGTVEHLLEITTETSILHLPIQAIVLTANSYQNRKPIHPQGGPSRNVLLLTEKPMSRDDVTRPSAKPNN